MNERIKQLWEEAAETIQGDSWEEMTKFMGRFAELIVKECADVAADQSAIKPEFRIRKHFGVEE